MGDVADCECCEELRGMKDAAYAERNRLVAWLASLFPSALARHPDDEEWDEDWRWIVLIESPAGQLSWHIHDSELPMFSHVPGCGGHERWKWDGHTTDEKYHRIMKAIDSRRGIGNG